MFSINSEIFIIEVRGVFSAVAIAVSAAVIVGVVAAVVAVAIGVGIGVSAVSIGVGIGVTAVTVGVSIAVTTNRGHLLSEEVSRSFRLDALGVELDSELSIEVSSKSASTDVSRSVESRLVVGGTDVGLEWSVAGMISSTD